MSDWHGEPCLVLGGAEELLREDDLRRLLRLGLVESVGEVGQLCVDTRSMVKWGQVKIWRPFSMAACVFKIRW